MNNNDSSRPRLVQDPFLGLPGLSPGLNSSPVSPATPAPWPLPGPVPFPYPFTPALPRSHQPLDFAQLQVPFAPLTRLPAIIEVLLARPLSDFEAERGFSSKSKPLTCTGLLLDRSRSMLRHRAVAIDGFNSLIAAVKDGATHAGETRVTLATFNSHPQILLDAASLEQLTPLDEASYTPDGGTALLDALGAVIASLLSKPGANDPSTAFLVSLFTDGDENASRTYACAVLRQVIERLEATGRWTFTLMGPSGETAGLAELLNLNAGNVATYNPAVQGSVREAFATMTCASSSYMSSRARGQSQTTTLYADLSKS